MLSDLSNQNRLHGAHADISIGRSVPNASTMSGAIGWRQFEQLGMPGFYGQAKVGGGAGRSTAGGFCLGARPRVSAFITPAPGVYGPAGPIPGRKELESSLGSRIVAGVVWGTEKGAPRRACRGVCRGCQDLAVVRSSLPCSSGVYRDPICGPKCNCAVENLDTNFLSPSATFIEAIISHCFNYKSTRCARLLLVSVAGLLEPTRRKG